VTNMSKDKPMPPMPTTSDYEVFVKSAHDVLAADLNGKSDPYVIVHYEAYHGTKLKSKSRVQKATLNPVWNFSASLSFVKPESKVKIEVFDKDPIGKDDYLGEVEFVLKNTADGKEKTEKLTGKKAKGEIFFTVTELGPYGDAEHLGASWTSYFCDVIADSKIDGRYKLVTDLRREFLKRSVGQKGKSGQRGLLVTQVMDCIKAVIPTKDTLPAEIFKLYEDNNDGVIDFFELCKFIRDIIALGMGALPKEAFATQVWFGLSYEDGQVDQKTLRKNLELLILGGAASKDPEPLAAKLDDVAERMMKAMDTDHSGIVTADELRAFSHSRTEFNVFVREINSTPAKKA